jgi:hypothetical protein
LNCACPGASRRRVQKTTDSSAVHISINPDISHLEMIDRPVVYQYKPLQTPTLYTKFRDRDNTIFDGR